jgi:hypothetical protein
VKKFLKRGNDNVWWVCHCGVKLFVILSIVNDEHQRKWNWWAKCCVNEKQTENKINEDEYKCRFNNFATCRKNSYVA